MLGFCKEKKSTLVVGVLAILMTTMAMVGGIRHYSPIPFWDMWGGTLGFYMKVSHGDWSAWWLQHNEHRIVLARILFWIDYKVFNGVSIFLLIMNYVLVGLSAYTFHLIAKHAAHENSKADQLKFISFVLIAWLFLWTQEENLTCAFQSQFILAQLLPLCAFFNLAKSHTLNIDKHYVYACLFGVLSAGSMVNGVLALPLMFVCSVLAKQHYSKSIILLMFAAIVNVLYFHDYIGAHGHFLDVLLQNPLGMLQYVLLYLGSPFFYIFGKSALMVTLLGKSAANAESFGKVMATIAGLSFIFSVTLISIKRILINNRSPLIITLVFFCIYIAGTALGTSWGRLDLGVDQALSSRYTTPAIMGWATLFVLIWSSARLSNLMLRRLFFWLGIVLAICMIGYQVQALNSWENEKSLRDTGALALAMNVKDPEYIEKVHPYKDWLFKTVDQAVSEDVGIFGQTPFINMRRDLNTQLSLEAKQTCLGLVDAIQSFPGDANYLRINGWIFNPATKSVPQSVMFLSQDSKVIGYALTGVRRKDIKKSFGYAAGGAGFRGYILKSATGGNVVAVAGDQSCRLNFFAEPYVISTVISTNNSFVDERFIKADKVILNQGFNGTDYSKSVFENKHLFASLVHSDGDKGHISFKANKGSKFYFSSGPTGGRQYLQINHGEITITLPVATEWSVITLDGERLPDNFEVTVIDDGKDWGEWSAIALIK